MAQMPLPSKPFAADKGGALEECIAHPHEYRGAQQIENNGENYCAPLVGLMGMCHVLAREQQGGGRRRGPRLERPGDGEYGAVESQMERSGKLDWFGCAAAQPRCRPRETGARTEVEEGARLLD